MNWNRHTNPLRLIRNIRRLGSRKMRKVVSKYLPKERIGFPV